jgi:hypothetical protein
MDGFVIQEQKEPWKGVMVQERRGVGADWSWLEKLVEVRHRETVQEALQKFGSSSWVRTCAVIAALEAKWNGEGFFTYHFPGGPDVRLVLADVMVRTTVTVDERLAPWP